MELYKLLPLNLQFFAADGGTGAGEGGEGNQEPENNPGGQGTNGGGTGESQTPPEEDNTFTQEDVNNVVAKETKKAQEKLFKELGIEDFENAKEGMKKFKKWQDSQKSEVEKKDEKIEGLEKSNAEVQAENQKLKAQISAMQKGVSSDSVEDVVTLASNLVSDDVDLDQAIDKVIEKYPHFSESGEGESSTTGKPRFSPGKHTRKTGSEPNSLAEALAQKFQ